MKPGCIGDDFTGSGDLANTLAKAGMRVVQYAGIPATPARAGVEAGVVALKTRPVPPVDAVVRSLPTRVCAGPAGLALPEDPR